VGERCKSLPFRERINGMANATYQPLVYNKQGATEFVVASSGLLTLESGGEMTVNSGGHIDVESGGYISVESGGNIRYPSESFSTAATLNNNGLSILTNASSAPATWTLTAPVAGVVKFVLFGTDFGSSAVGYVNAGSGVTFESSVSSTNAFCRVAESDHRVTFLGVNTTSWMVTYKTTGVTFTTGTT
jgi:hypothetical protein